MCRTKVKSQDVTGKLQSGRFLCHVLAYNCSSTHRTFIFIRVLDLSVSQHSEKYILRCGILSIGYRKKLTSGQ